MTKLIAYLGITALAFASMLGNYWYTFGLWPRSWVSFAAFFVVSSTIQALFAAVKREDK